MERSIRLRHVAGRRGPVTVVQPSGIHVVDVR
jgi:hypothetical protein